MQHVHPPVFYKFKVGSILEPVSPTLTEWWVRFGFKFGLFGSPKPSVAKYLASIPDVSRLVARWAQA
jgi:hypothetical protein